MILFSESQRFGAEARGLKEVEIEPKREYLAGLFHKAKKQHFKQYIIDYYKFPLLNQLWVTRYLKVFKIFL